MSQTFTIASMPMLWSRVDDETKKEVDAAAADRGQSVSGVVANTLRKVFVTHEITIEDRLKASVKKSSKAKAKRK